MNKNWLIGIVAVVVLVIGSFLVLGHSTTPKTPSSGNVLQVVAAENFWGSLVSQIGGSHVQVLSIVSDPNADPHEYESNTTDARAISTANYVIENGAGYDSWADKLLNAGGNPNRKVLNVATLLGKKEGDNPHFWYNPAYVNQVAAQIEQDLMAIDPNNANYYKAQYATLQSSLAGYQTQITQIKQKYAGVKVGATEDIFVYFADAAGLDLTTPPQFIQAVGDGNDPPASSVVTFENQIKNKQIKVLVYNVQTNTPVTENIKSLAQSNNIPIVPISETMQPANAQFQDWMNAEVTALANALASTTVK
jgi:zinc/manganese transport system substrate-binding protein